MEQVKISKETQDFAEKNRMEVIPYGEGVVYIRYYRAIRNEEENTAKVISLLKRDNPSLMVTGLVAFVTSICAMGTIVNFEVKL